MNSWYKTTLVSYSWLLGDGAKGGPVSAVYLWHQQGRVLNQGSLGSWRLEKPQDTFTRMSCIWPWCQPRSQMGCQAPPLKCGLSKCWGILLCFFLILFFSWWKIVLQYRVGFCPATHTHIHIYTHTQHIHIHNTDTHTHTHTHIYNNTHTYASRPSGASLPSPYQTPLGHHRARSWPPCVISQVLAKYLFYPW